MTTKSTSDVMAKIEEALQNSAKVAKPKWEKLYEIWQKLGIPEDKQEYRSKTVLMHLENLLDQMVQEENELLEKKIVAVERLEEEVAELCRELEVDIKTVASQPDSTKSLLVLEKSMRQCLKDLHHQREERLQELGSLQQTQQSLCDALNKTPYYVPTGKVPSAKDLKGVKDHIETLKKMKSEQLQRLIEEVRDELLGWWNKTYVTSEQRQRFTPLFTEFTEENLELLRAEVVSRKEYFERNAIMLEKVQRWQKLWDAFIDLENRANDPYRYKNRGGTLLQEENERKRIKKELPKVQDEVRQQIEDWERQEGQEFLVGGERFMDYIQNQWIAYEESKKTEKELKQKSKAMELQTEMIYGSRPVTTPKRRIVGAIITPSKYQKVDEHTLKTPASTSRLGRTNYTNLHSPCFATPRSVSKVNKRTPPTRVLSRKSKELRRRSGIALRKALAYRNKSIKHTSKATPGVGGIRSFTNTELSACQDNTKHKVSKTPTGPSHPVKNRTYSKEPLPIVRAKQRTHPESPISSPFTDDATLIEPRTSTPTSYPFSAQRKNSYIRGTTIVNDKENVKAPQDQALGYPFSDRRLPSPKRGAHAPASDKRSRRHSESPPLLQYPFNERRDNSPKTTSTPVVTPKRKAVELTPDSASLGYPFSPRTESGRRLQLIHNTSAGTLFHNDQLRACGHASPLFLVHEDTPPVQRCFSRVDALFQLESPQWKSADVLSKH